VVRQGLGTRLLTLLTLDPGKFRGPPCTETDSRASKVEQEETMDLDLDHTSRQPSQ